MWPGVPFAFEKEFHLNSRGKRGIIWQSFSLSFLDIFHFFLAMPYTILWTFRLLLFYYPPCPGPNE